MTFADELRKEGEEIGIAKGQEIGIRQTAINALKQGIAPKDVANFSGLSLTEVNKLAAESKLH